jgi:hypothetical protein
VICGCDGSTNPAESEQQSEDDAQHDCELTTGSIVCSVQRRRHEGETREFMVNFMEEAIAIAPLLGRPDVSLLFE